MVGTQKTSRTLQGKDVLLPPVFEKSRVCNLFVCLFVCNLFVAVQGRGQTADKIAYLAAAAVVVVPPSLSPSVHVLHNKSSV